MDRQERRREGGRKVKGGEKGRGQKEGLRPGVLI